MPLAPGTRFGDYDVIGSLGSGGMGQVFKARDTRLGRAVALKVVSPALTADPQAAARLVREARTLASISHPHVCALYQLAQHDDHSVLVMEYLEGTTLAERLERGRLPLGESLRIAIDIADGLAAAHRAGVVHRDLKPENVMLTAAGAKLVDFGLARPQVAVLHGSIAETASRQALTAAGTIAGTFPYMAPEQIEGRTLDARTDIWAFGCVLYEMVTGRRTFAGVSPASLIAAILEREPPPAASLEPAASGALDRAIRRCLVKDPDGRWQSAQDLRDELRWIAEGADGLAAAVPSGAPMWRRYLMSAAAGAACTAALLVWMSPPWHVQPAGREVSRLELTIPRLASPSSLSLSPDGRHLAFTAGNAEGRRIVWIRTFSEAAPRPLAGTEDASPASPAIWSPDSRWITFVSGGKLRKIEAAGGDAITLADITGDVLSGSWSAAGTILVGTQHVSPTHGVHSVSATGGRLVPLVPLEPGAFLHGIPKFLPDDRRFVYLTWAFDESRRELCLASLDDPSGRCLGIKAHYAAGLTDDGYFVYARAGTLLAQRFDTEAGRPDGEPLILAEGLARDPFGRTAVSVARERTLVYQTAPPEVRQFVWVGRDGRITRTSGEAGAYGGFDVSTAGDYIIAERTERGATGLWLIDVARGVTTPVGSVPNAAHSAGRGVDHFLGPAFAADPGRFFYRTIRNGTIVIVEARTRGGDERVVYTYGGNGVFYLADVSDDGRVLIIGVAEPTRRYLAAVRGEGSDPIVLAEGALDLASARLSPDGRWVAYSTADFGQEQVYVAPLSSSGERWQISSGGGVQPEWRRAPPDELYYIAPDGALMAVPVTTAGSKFDSGLPKPLFGTSSLTRFRLPGYRVTADGQRFVLNALREGDAAATTSTLQVVLNWTAGLK